jgi:puromycin-sensitive aminopeptidase
MVEGFADETDLSVWQRIVGALGSLDRLVDGDTRDTFRLRVAALVGPALERLGSDPHEGDSDRDRGLRGVLIEAMGVLADDPATQDRARAVLARADADASDPSVLAASIAIVAASGDPDDFDAFVERMNDASTPQEELRYLYALCGFGDPALMSRLLAMTVTDDIRTQNAPYVIARAMGNREQGPLAWSFVTEHWDELNERFPSNSIVRMLSGIRSLTEPEVADAVYAFFEIHEVPQGDKQLAQHLERLEVGVALRARDAETLAHHLTH